VRLLCDTGLIGCALFVAVVLGCLFQGIQIARSSSAVEVGAMGAASAAVAAATLFIMGFDTAINCALPVMQYPFALLGMALGAQRLAAFQVVDRARMCRPQRAAWTRR